MKRKLIYFLASFFLMLLSGLFWGTWLTMVNSIESLSSDEFLHIGKLIINNTSLPTLLLIILCLIMMALALWFYRYKRSTGFYLGLASFFLIIANLIIIWIFMVPIEHQISGWTHTSLPPQWEYIRGQWKLFYALGTLVVLTSFGCFSWFILAAMRKNKTANY
jgi:hypothetical protein